MGVLGGRRGMYRRLSSSPYFSMVMQDKVWASAHPEDHNRSWLLSASSYRVHLLFPSTVTLVAYTPNKSPIMTPMATDCTIAQEQPLS